MKRDTLSTAGARTAKAMIYKPAPAMADVAAGKAELRKGQQGDSIQQLQKMLGMKGSAVDGQFGPNTDKAVRRFQQAHGLLVDGKVGPHTFAALKKGASTGSTTGHSNGPVLGNGARIDTHNPILQKLASSPLRDGPTGYCVLTTLNNMKRLGIPHTPEATGQDPNNPRGGMAQMLRNGGWVSVPFPGAHQESIHSPYGNTTANVVSADQYRQLIADGKVPSGAIIFQSRHGWGWNAGSKGNDMGIVRDHGRLTHNYKTMNSIIYSDCKSVVILVPKDALKTS
ncbi:peptidoglycan-binding protein [Archangium gephyra]|uniref:peptidoglycan-binding domain-containing protein n=1 Tax=Archangium gephyra TaxID=48 RepID=UPI0035D4C835